MAVNHSKEDAVETLRFSVLMGMTERAHLTKIQAGPQSDMLLEDIMAAILDPSVRWMLTRLGQEQET